MPRHIKTFSDGTSLEYDRGNFDHWCVYHRTPGLGRRAPYDVEYFDALRVLARSHSADRVYADFVGVYEKTTADLDGALLAHIEQVAEGYGPDRHRFDLTMTTIYAAMVAEERRGLPLGKKVKRLGIHQTLHEGLAPNVAANFSKGKRAAELSALCRSKGF